MQKIVCSLAEKLLSYRRWQRGIRYCKFFENCMSEAHQKGISKENQKRRSRKQHQRKVTEILNRSLKQSHLQ